MSGLGVAARLLIASLSLTLPMSCADPETASLVPPADYEQRWQDWRETRRQELTAEDGWLSLTGLIWLEPGNWTLGLDDSMDIVLPESPGTSGLPRKLGTLKVGGTSDSPASAGVLFSCDPELAARAEATVCQTNPVDDGQSGGALPDLDLANSERGGLRLGTLDIIAIERGGEYALRVRDGALVAERARQLPELATFPLDSGLLLAGTFEPAPDGQTVAVPNVTKRTYNQVTAGTVSFRLGGQRYRLVALGSSASEPLLLVVGDMTNGAETYAGGRYVYVSVADNGRDVEIDLNRLYNPPCVFTDFATCPLPPPQNRLGVRLEAGERAVPEADA